jgi:membrane protein required for colicin V production
VNPAATGINAVDAAILVVMALSSLFGLWRGLVKEVLSLLTWIVALVLGRLFSNDAGTLFAGMVESEVARQVLGFAVIFVVVMMLGTALNHLLAKVLSVTGLKLADRIFGGAFGLMRGTVIVMVGLFLANAFFSETVLWQESTLIPYGMVLIDWSRQVLGEASASGAVAQLSFW